MALINRPEQAKNRIGASSMMTPRAALSAMPNGLDLTGAGTATRWAPSQILTLLGLVAVAAVVLANYDWTGWSPILLAIVPSVGAWLVRRTSLLVTIYLSQIAIYFGLTWLLRRQERPSLLVVVVVLWTLGMTIGALTSRTRTAAPADRRWNPPRWPHFALTAGLMSIQLGLILSDRLGYKAQLTTGITTPTGLLGILTTAGPIVTLMLLISALGSQRGVAGAALLAMLQTAVMSLSGARGTGLVFLIAIVAAAAMTLPKMSPWRRPGRIIVVVVILSAAAVTSFIVGAQIKSRVATELRVTSEGTMVFGLDQAVPNIATRIDLGDALYKAVELRDDPIVQHAVSWTSQVQAFVPRFIWSHKPIMDYGQRVSVAVYGLEYGQSSSTISTVGDALVNFGIPGIVIASLLVGFAMSHAERRIRAGTSLPSLVLATALSAFVIGQEAPLILSVAGLIRNLVIASLLWLACDAYITASQRKRVAPQPQGSAQ